MIDQMRPRVKSFSIALHGHEIDHTNSKEEEGFGAPFGNATRW
jgi:hypothetical protein